MRGEDGRRERRTVKPLQVGGAFGVLPAGGELCVELFEQPLRDDEGDAELEQEELAHPVDVLRVLVEPLV